MVIAIKLDIPQSPLFPLLEYSSSSSSSSSGHSGHQALSSADIVSLLLSRPPRQFSANSSYTRSKLQGDLNKPLPDIPTASFVNIPPHAIISLLDLLDKLDADVEEQVSRVKDNIEDARQLVDTCRQERVARQERARKAREAIKRETKEIGCDFWLGV
ncbi:hypothetical protein BDZ89DRAFT_1056876 [Hymenopellis radicata]|nr:hypothetical protein BDZ89DRAFT_1056876 [Hymenopellis radicata]